MFVVLVGISERLGIEERGIRVVAGTIAVLHRKEGLSVGREHHVGRQERHVDRVVEQAAVRVQGAVQGATRN